MFSWEIDENIRLALPQHYMAEEITTLIHENFNRLRPWMNWAVEDYSVETARGFISRSLSSFAEDGRFEACLLWEDKIIGTIGFHGVDHLNRSAYIGYWIAKEYEGRGIITKSCRVLIDHLFNDLQLNRIAITCNVDNSRSRAVPERLGFSFEGIRRQAEFLHDHFGDWAVYALLREEWQIITERAQSQRI